MKRAIIRFKEPISTRHYEIFYKDVPKILTRYHIKKLVKKHCWDIEIIDDEELERILDEQYFEERTFEKKILDDFYDLENHYEDIEKHVTFIE